MAAFLASNVYGQSPKACAQKQAVTLYLGPSIGQGTSGIVYPVLSSKDSSETSKREVCIHEGTEAGIIQKLNCAPSMRYVAKEVQLEESTRDSILKEVELHRDCSKRCPGVVEYILSGMTPGEDASLIVVMEACQGELWDTLNAYRGDASGSRPSLRRSGSSIKPGVTRSSSRVSISAGLNSGSAGSAARLPSENEKLAWTKSLCETLRHCHSFGVLHRDLNPWNVLIAANKTPDGSRTIRLADFGLAVRLSNLGMKLSGLEAEGAVPLDDSALGSLYSAPELGVEYGLPADIFSLGMVLLAIWSTVDVAMPDGGQSEDALITCVEGVKNAAVEGVQPADNILSSMKEGCDSNLRTLILRMLSKQADKRPTASEAYDLVQAWLSQRGGFIGEGPEIPRSGFARLCKCLRPRPEVQSSSVIDKE